MVAHIVISVFGRLKQKDYEFSSKSVRHCQREERGRKVGAEEGGEQCLNAAFWGSS